MKKELRAKFLTIIGCAGLLAASAGANTITFTTPVGMVDSAGDPVDASATFITGVNTVKITLTDLLNNPTSVGQLISDISFSLTSGQTLATINPGTATGRTVNSGGTFSDAPVATGWGVDPTFSGGIHITALGFVGPKQLIIGGPGPGNLYSAANGSIAANKPHNPFLFGPVTFTLTVLGVNVDSSVNNVLFSFGTTPGDNGHVPDGGTTALLLGTALSGLALIRRKLK